MESQPYPGKGLSLTQLVFALNAELNSMVHSSSLSLDQVSQLAKDISTASAAIHELRNSLVPVNRLPLDVLLLVPTHLASLSDRLRATFVCRHWRRVFVQHAPLWSRLSLNERTDQSLLTTLLERVKQSPLDITICYYNSNNPESVLLSPFAPQIRQIVVRGAGEGHIQDLSNVVSGSLPLLHTLYIREDRNPYGPRSSSNSTPLLFNGAVNVKNFDLRTHSSSLLSQFSFQNLTTLKFSQVGEGYPASLLLNFLESSPSLQEIDIEITGRISYEDVPPDRVLVLPCVKNFCLTLKSDSGGWKLATHLSCPSANSAVFSSGPVYLGHSISKDIYPTALQWSAITRQYTTSTAEQVVFNIEVGKSELICTMTFRSSNTTLGLYYNHRIRNIDDRTLAKKVGPDLFSQASRTILDHPLRDNIGSLCIRDSGFLAGDLGLAASNIGKLLGSMGSLKRLILVDCDLRPYLDPFLETPLFPDTIQPTSFPPIKMLTIRGPIQSLCDGKTYAVAVIKLVKSQHGRGMPFECVRLRTPAPAWVVEELLLSVDKVECDEILSGGGEDQR